MQTIIFDIDDTSGDLRVHTERLYRIATGDDKISYNDWVDYHVENRYGITGQGLGDLFIADESLQKMKPNEGLAEVVAILKSRDYNIEFVTARGWHPEGYSITQKWLDDHFVYYDKINIVGLYESKEEATRHIDRIKLFIDDRIDHCEAMRDSGRVEQSLVYCQPWNAHCEDGPSIKRITSLYDVLEYA